MDEKGKLSNFMQDASKLPRKITLSKLIGLSLMVLIFLLSYLVNYGILVAVNKTFLPILGNDSSAI